MIEENEFLEIERHPDGVPLPEVFLGRMEVCIDLISRGVPAQHACAASGVRRKDFDYVLKHHEILSNRIANARFQAVESLKNEIANAGKLQKRKRTINHSNGAVTTIEDEIVGDWKASAWLLERFDRDNFGPAEIPAGSYFLLGDNRDISIDSRFDGVVLRENIFGKVTEKSNTKELSVIIK